MTSVNVSALESERDQLKRDIAAKQLRLAQVDNALLKHEHEELTAQMARLQVLEQNIPYRTPPPSRIEKWRTSMPEFVTLNDREHEAYMMSQTRYTETEDALAEQARRTSLALPPRGARSVFTNVYDNMHRDYVARHPPPPEVDDAHK